jgi:hypothetical protein
MTTITARQPKGIPVGGQFAATIHAEPAADLHVPLTVHERTHVGLVGDQLNSHEEAQAARDAIYESMTAGDFGGDALAVRDLAKDDRLVRLAVDRYVTTEHNEPGAFQPEDTGHRLGRLLMDLQNEDIEDAVYALKDGRS